MKMSKYDRLLYILNLLRTRRNLNAASLAKECGVTERSIYRDVLALSEANIPIYFDNGYKLATDNFLPPLNFDFDEYTALKAALESTPLAETERYKSVLKQVLAKIDAGLSGTVREKTRFSPTTTHVEILTSNDLHRDAGFYTIIEQGITEMQTLELTYNSITSGVTHREVDPYFIIFRGKAFYFVAYCHLRKETRTFRLDRLKDVRLTEKSFNRSNDIKPETYFEGSWEVYSGEPVTVKVRFTGAAGRVVQSGTHHENEIVAVVSDDEVIYEVETRGIEEIQRWIIGFGDEAEVLEPILMRNNLQRIGRYLSSIYNQKGDNST